MYHPFNNLVNKLRSSQPRWLLILAVVIFLISACTQQIPSPETQTPPPPEEPDFTAEEAEYIEARQQLVEHAIATMNLQDEDVINTLNTVPRHRFVPADLVHMAYNDSALPIGYGQTISQPSLVARMTELLELNPGDKVLEIGTGSGYQAALLAELGYVEVFSIEIVPELNERSSDILSELGYTDVQTMQGDGYYGWPEHAPFDAIIVTAAPDHVPAPLVEQLAEGGIMVIPIGPPGWYQTLWKFVKQNGELTAYNMGGVAFVPFIGEGIEGVRTPTP